MPPKSGCLDGFLISLQAVPVTHNSAAHTLGSSEGKGEQEETLGKGSLGTVSNGSKTQTVRTETLHLQLAFLRRAVKHRLADSAL